MLVRINRTEPDPDAEGFVLVTMPDHYTTDEMMDAADSVIDIAEAQNRSDYVLVMRRGVTMERLD